MTASWDPSLGAVTYGEDEQGQVITDPGYDAMPREDLFADVQRPDEDPLDYYARISAKRQQLEAEQAAAAAMSSSDNKPWISDKLVSDTVKVTANAVPAFFTDLVDLGLGAVDLVSEGTKATVDPNYDFNWNNVMDDSDNPLTQWRRRTFTPGGFDTKTGELANLVVRLGGDVVGFKWVAKMPLVANRVRSIGRIVGLVSKAGDVAGGLRSTRAAKKLGQLDALSRTARQGRRLSALEGAATKGSQLGAAARRARRNDYLSSTFETISKMDDAGDAVNWWKKTVKSAKAYGRDKVKIKTLAETIGWDSLAAFSVVGEGDDFMDETFFDALGEWGIENPLESDPLDNGLWRKAKGVADATFTGLLFGAFIDVFRISRFSSALKKATPAERKKLLQAFELSSDEMGRAVAQLVEQSEPALPLGSALDRPGYGFGMAPRGPMAGRMPNRVDPSLDPWGEGGGQLVRQTPMGTAPDPWETAELRRVRTEISDLERAEAEATLNAQKALAGAQPPAGALPGAPGPAGLLPGSDMPNPFPDGSGVIAAGNRIRAAEPTISPMGIRRFSREMLFAGYTPDQVSKAIVEALPRRRVDLIEYLEQGVRITEDGTLDAADSVWSNYILTRGRDEGWAQISQSGDVTFIRSAAAAVDQTDLVTKQAQALDEAQELERLRYQTALQEMDSRQANAGQLDPSVQARLARRDADQTGVPIDVDQATKLADDELAAAPVPDPAVDNAQINAVDTAMTADAITEEELGRFATDVTAPNPDEQVRELLGIDPDAIEVTLEKAEGGRGWVVVGPSGEQVGERFATKRAAQKKANAEKRRLQDEVRKRAQQVADDEVGNVADFSRYDPARDSDIMGKVKLTQPQINELIKYPNFRPIFDQFGVSKKTYSFTQGDMNDFVDGARAMIASGVDKRRAQMLRKLIDKFDTAVKLIEPEVRQAREIESMTDQTKRYLQHGDFC